MNATANAENRLGREKSPYLLQHADDPVHWYPWGEEAFFSAAREDKPIFLSIGYSTCHWCHVMGRESFRDPEVAKVLNRSFVSIKVDREERPDVDAVYMDACQALTGSGGWPLTILMTADQKPFWAGTYLPPRGREGRGGLVELLEEVERQLETLPRREIAQASMERNGKILLVRDIRQAIQAANDLAPEHLELCVDEPFACLDEVRHAGSIFLGRSCPEALGDYFAGPNHTLPTSGTARFSSPLSVDDFVKKSQFTYYTPAALEKAAGKIARFAREEGLEGHARSALSRLREEERP